MNVICEAINLYTTKEEYIWVLGLTLDPKLTYSAHIHNISVQAHKPLQIIKALTATGWGKQKETLMATYKAVMRPALEYASSVWSPIASSTSINKLQVMQNAALRTATGCTQDTNIQHLHDETLTLPIYEHLQLHASQYKQKTQHPSHPLHKHTTYFNTPRLKKTLFLTTVISSTAPTLSPLDLWTNPAGVTAQMDGEAGWWTTSGNIGLPPLARAMGVGRQQQEYTLAICLMNFLFYVIMKL